MDAVSKLRRYLPSGLAEKILAQRGRIEGERREVTVLFADLVGFTPLTEKLGPEEAYGLMDEVYEVLIHKVHDFEGTVNELTGDGIMALFGAPIALEDAPQRAIRSALAIHREMARFEERLKKEGKDIPQLRMRIGIHTGPVVVGTVGNDLRVDFKAVGDTVNLASRIEGLAEPRTTFVSGDTFRLTEGLFRFEGLGKKSIKGKIEPVEIYRVLAPSTRKTRFDVSTERGLAPFVGRHRELELLLDAYNRANEGRGQAVSIVADAGFGKSRLLYEFRKAIANEKITFLEGKCLSYSRGVAYHPIIDILQGNFDIQDGDTDEAVRDKVSRGLGALGLNDAGTKPYLFELLSVKESGIDPTMRPETRRDRTFQALSRIVMKGAEIRPLLLAVEDLHWIDKSSEDALKDLSGRIAGARVLLLFTHRPEYVYAWGNRSYHSQVSLNRLSNRETLALIGHVLGDDEVAENLVSTVYDKSEGVPFFIEEMVKSLRERGLVEKRGSRWILARESRDLAIPSTIQDVLLTRVDGLPQGAKEVLQIGSVIEREFTHALIARVAGVAESELLSCLSALKDAELLYERGVYPSSSYVFKHALTREVVYGSILARKKKELHENIGNAIEQQSGEDAAESHGALYEHFLASENYAKAARYARFAGKRAEQEASFASAIDWAKKRIACLERLTADPRTTEEIIDARTMLGLYITQIGQFTAAKEAIDPITDIVLRGKHDRKRAQVLTIIGIYKDQIEGDAEASIRGIESALAIAAEKNDRAATFFAHFWLGAALFNNCQFERATPHIEKCLEINRAAKSPWGEVAMKATLAWLRAFQGDIGLAHAISLEAARQAEEVGDIWACAWAFNAHGLSLYCKGELDGAIEYLTKGVDCGERGMQFVDLLLSHQWLGVIYRELGRNASAREHFLHAVQVGEDNRVKDIPAMMLKLEQWEAGELPLEANPIASGLGTKFRRRTYQGLVKREIGNTLLRMANDYSVSAERWFQDAIETDKRHGQRWDLAMDHACYAEWLGSRGNAPMSREEFGKAIALFRECGADIRARNTEDRLAKLGY